MRALCMDESSKGDEENPQERSYSRIVSRGGACRDTKSCECFGLTPVFFSFSLLFSVLLKFELKFAVSASHLPRSAFRKNDGF